MSIGLKKSTLTRTINASRKLPASAGEFLPVTCGNFRQLLPAENFACVPQLFFRRNSIRAATAGNFARASFTVYNVKLARAKSPANAVNFTCSSQVKRPHTQFTCVTWSLPVKTDKFTCFHGASTARIDCSHM